MDNRDGTFDAMTQAAWRKSWPKLVNDVESLILVAFRVLVFHLDLYGFFLQSSSGSVAYAQSVVPDDLNRLLRTSEPKDVWAFAGFVAAVLNSKSLNDAASLAFAIDAQFGPTLSRSLANDDDRTGLQNLTRVVNRANTVLMEQLPEVRPIILVKRERYWPRQEQVVSPYHRKGQGTASYFHRLLPTSTRLKRVHYSAIGGGSTERLIVTLWPTKGPSINSNAISKSSVINGQVKFHFKAWDDLPKTNKKNQRIFAKQIAKYIKQERLDTLNTVHIVAAPELTLPTESLEVIVTAVSSRSNAKWIVFPGSYHIKMDEGVINRAPIYLGGRLNQTDLAESFPHPDTAAIKRTEVVFPGRSHDLAEDIDGRESLTHLLDTSVGRIAVMICRDFIEDDLRNDIVSTSVDHLFVLSMSPDSGRRFAAAMENVSNYQTACFYVNAFSKKSRPAGYRFPLRRARVRWRRFDESRSYTVIDLK